MNAQMTTLPNRGNFFDFFQGHCWGAPLAIFEGRPLKFPNRSTAFNFYPKLKVRKLILASLSLGVGFFDFFQGALWGRIILLEIIKSIHSLQILIRLS